MNIFINQLHNVYMFVKFLNLFLNFICVVSSAFFFPASINKSILVSDSTISVTSDVTMESVNVTSVPDPRFICRRQCRVFFQQPSSLLLRAVNICKLRVHCHDFCNIAPSKCICVNYVNVC